MVFFEICLFECFYFFPFGTQQREEVFIPLTRATWKMELILLSFVFLQFSYHGGSHRSTYTCFSLFKFFLLWDRSPLRPEIGLNPTFCTRWNLINKGKCRHFFKFAFLNVFCLPPFGTQQREEVFISLTRATGKIELTLLSFVLESSIDSNILES